MGLALVQHAKSLDDRGLVSKYSQLGGNPHKVLASPVDLGVVLTRLGNLQLEGPNLVPQRRELATGASQV